jgi:hypothetical protein
MHLTCVAHLFFHLKKRVQIPVQIQLVRVLLVRFKFIQRYEVVVDVVVGQKDCQRLSANRGLLYFMNDCVKFFKREYICFDGAKPSCTRRANF